MRASAARAGLAVPAARVLTPVQSIAPGLVRPLSPCRRDRLEEGVRRILKLWFLEIERIPGVGATHELNFNIERFRNIKADSLEQAYPRSTRKT